MQDAQLHSEAAEGRTSRTPAADPAALAGSVREHESQRVSAKRRDRARLRPWLGAAVLLAPAALSVLLDGMRRASQWRRFDLEHFAAYAASAVESSLVWGVLLYAAARRRGAPRWLYAALFVGLLTFTFGGQAYFHQQYGAYLNVDVSVFASNFMDSVVNQLFADFGNYLRSKLPMMAVAVALVLVARRTLRPSRQKARFATALAPLLVMASFFVPTQHRHLQAATPDTLYLHAIGGVIRTQLGFTDQSNQVRPRVRESLPVPALIPQREGAARNVLLIILESVRADSACSEYDPECQKTGYSNQLLPNRKPLLQLRALDSSTAISLAVLWSGVGPHEDRDVLHTWPLIFDYARSAGYDTAFWTSQNMMFGNSRLWVKNLGVSKFCSATDLDPTADLDMGAPEHLLAERVNREITQLKEPFLAVVQLSNVHYPYYVEADGPQPFQPATTSKAPEDNHAFKNQYQNAVHQQDRHVAAMIRHLRQSDAGQRTVIVYTSDHGEAFREHGQMGHTFSVFDEEIHVPGFVDAPAGTLSDSELAALETKREAYTFHVDITPTVLDLIGVWDDPAIAQYRTKMLGTSLLRPELTERALPMTNCAGVWSCAFENWGYMQKNMKLESRAWDTGYKCYDLDTDPFELRDLGVAACGDLADRAERTFKRLPGQDIPKPER